MEEDERAHAVLRQAARAPAGVPGAWAAVIVGIVWALGIGVLARPGAAAADGAGPAGVSRLAEVQPGEMDAALETVEGSSEDIAKFRARASCRRKLAWVSIAGVGSRPVGRIRLQSGRYLSSAFALTGAPVRVAIPYPAAYESGRGTIAVIGTSVDARLALTPAWQVTAQQGFQSRAVTWTPIGCPAANPPAE